MPDRPDLDEEAWRRILTEGHGATVSIARTVFRYLPSAPRCKECFAPFGGIGGRIARLAGKRPSRKNPNLCHQ
jgi:adenylate cyclase